MLRKNLFLLLFPSLCVQTGAAWGAFTLKRGKDS